MCYYQTMNPNTSLTNVIYGLSCTCHPEKGYRYVGQTEKTAANRLYRHIYYTENWHKYKGQNDLPVYKWIRKHGKENILTTVLEAFDSPDPLDDAEIRWIAEVGTFGGRGLNLSEGGRSLRGYKHTPETREKMRGRFYTDETRSKMSESAKKRGQTPGLVAYMRAREDGDHPNTFLTVDQVLEIKRRLWDGESVSVLAKELGCNLSIISHISGGYSWQNTPWPIGPRRKARTSELMSEARTGRTHTEESKKLMSEKASARRATPESKAKYQAYYDRAGSSNAKVTPDDVREIRRLREETGLTYKEIGLLYGIGPENTSNICRRKSWPNVV